MVKQTQTDWTHVSEIRHLQKQSQNFFLLLFKKKLHLCRGIQNGPSKICGRQPLKNSIWFILEYLDPFIHIPKKPFFNPLNPSEGLWAYLMGTDKTSTS